MHSVVVDFGLDSRFCLDNCKLCTAAEQHGGNPKMVSHCTVDSAHTLREGDSVVDNHTPARGILDMFFGQDLAQDLVEGQGRAIAGRGLQQDLVPGCGRKTYPGGQGMGCDYNIIATLEKSNI